MFVQMSAKSKISKILLRYLTVITQSYVDSCSTSVGEVATGGRALDHQKQVAASQTEILATCR